MDPIPQETVPIRSWDTRSWGPTREQVIRGSGARRFRPILITTLATFSPVFPEGICRRRSPSRWRRAWASAMSASAVTLLIVPVLYRALEDLPGLPRRRSAPSAAAGA